MSSIFYVTYEVYVRDLTSFVTFYYQTFKIGGHRGLVGLFAYPRRQGSTVRNSVSHLSLSPLFFVEVTASSCSRWWPMRYDPKNEGALMKRRKTRKRGTPAGGKGGSGDLKRAGAAIENKIWKWNGIRERLLVRLSKLIKWWTPIKGRTWWEKLKNICETAMRGAYFRTPNIQNSRIQWIINNFYL